MSILAMPTVDAPSAWVSRSTSYTETSQPLPYRAYERILVEILSNDCPTITYSNREVFISIPTDHFRACFDIKIDGVDYTITLYGKKEYLEDTPRIQDRTNPLLQRGVTQISDILPIDIPKEGIVWQLSWSQSMSPLQTSDIFWNALRKRIPSTHPLSTFNQNSPLS